MPTNLIFPGLFCTPIPTREEETKSPSLLNSKAQRYFASSKRTLAILPRNTHYKQWYNSTQLSCMPLSVPIVLVLMANESKGKVRWANRKIIFFITMTCSLCKLSLSNMAFLRKNFLIIRGFKITSRFSPPNMKVSIIFSAPGSLPYLAIDFEIRITQPDKHAKGC